MELRPAIYVVMACAFGACSDDEVQTCNKEPAQCVCKPTMKLDLSQLEPPPGGATLCNNATFEWMVNALLVEMSRLNQRAADLDAHTAKQQTEISQLKAEVKRVTVERDRAVEESQKDREEAERRVREAEGRAAGCTHSQTEVQELHDRIKELERAERRLEFENVQLTERAAHADRELETMKLQSAKKPRDCADIQREGYRSSGVFTVHPEGWDTKDGVEVFCDLFTDGGGWMVIQRRQDGSQPFDLEWDDYKRGFGKVAREFWMGNDFIHHVTSGQREYALRVDMVDMAGAAGHALYGRFSLGDAQSQYTIRVKDFEGTIGDSLSHHDGAPFSTRDVDNDSSRSGHCSRLYGDGGWWFVRCHDSNLNGQYGKTDKTGIMWIHWKEMEKAVRHVEMKIRPVYFGKQQQ